MTIDSLQDIIISMSYNKRLFILVFSLFTFLYLSPSNFASQNDSLLTVTVDVDTIFQLELDTSSVDFSQVEPGAQTPESGINISCLTNVNVPWKISMHSQGPLSFEGYEIPNSNFHWKVEKKNTGAQLQSGNVSQDPTYIYSSTPNEAITETPVELFLSFYVDVPSGQPAGRYNTVVTVTMQAAQ